MTSRLRLLFVGIAIYISGMLSGALLSKTIDFENFIPPVIKERHIDRTDNLP